MRVTKHDLVKFSLFMAFSLFWYTFAHAEVRLMVDQPKGKVTATEAVKAARNGKQVFACEKRYIDQGSGRARKVKGSKVTLHVSPGEDQENAGEAFGEGKQVFACTSKQWNGKKFETVD